MGDAPWRWVELDARLSSRIRLSPPAVGMGFNDRMLWITAVILAHSGDSWLCMAVFGLVWLIGGHDARRLAVLFAAAVVLQALIIFPLKQAIRRERPQGEWGSIYRTIDPHSFPSGHATRAALLVVLAFGLGSAPAWLGWALLAWAPLVSLARVGTGVHYLTDVLGGILIGLLMGAAFLTIQGFVAQMLVFLV